MIRCSLSSILSSVKHIVQDVNRKAQNRTCKQRFKGIKGKVEQEVVTYESDFDSTGVGGMGGGGGGVITTVASSCGGGGGGTDVSSGGGGGGGGDSPGGGGVLLPKNQHNIK